jgi:hypothetical protein
MGRDPGSDRALLFQRHAGASVPPVVMSAKDLSLSGRGFNLLLIVSGDISAAWPCPDGSLFFFDKPGGLH